MPSLRSVAGDASGALPRLAILLFIFWRNRRRTSALSRPPLHTQEARHAARRGDVRRRRRREGPARSGAPGWRGGRGARYEYGAVGGLAPWSREATLRSSARHSPSGSERDHLLARGDAPHAGFAGPWYPPNPICLQGRCPPRRRAQRLLRQQQLQWRRGSSPTGTARGRLSCAGKSPTRGAYSTKRVSGPLTRFRCTPTAGPPHPLRAEVITCPTFLPLLLALQQKDKVMCAAPPTARRAR